ncbi:peptide-N(4)-(N-acetyl-beta-glucosaminyl)asparagine amidase [Dorcoceras hygrometricum]|uniref:Peptide-N(4)-(N-acetyl-beta-glucosaminyl)asparagine amidase n=1 Tax=Dorcoceras hygrometricum TaxID=472368 RepID=A0A2Z7A370_9LAMI|nr:peptide-N(4)-(N-acetyl-beta-glucosaminyl)asparagine amidase [Dorcoceras hygrometricum]
MDDSHQHFTKLQTNMVRNYADNHQQLVDELASVKSQLAVMVESMKEFGAEKKGELSKKMMNSRRICPADGSQYKDSAVGLVFMESAAGLAMETSKVESAVRNQAEAKLNQPEHTVTNPETVTTSEKITCDVYFEVSRANTNRSFYSPIHGYHYPDSYCSILPKKQDMESAVMTSVVMSSQSAVGYQQMKRSERDEATSCWRISRWFSVDDVIGDVIIISRWFERAVARISSHWNYFKLKPDMQGYDTD